MTTRRKVTVQLAGVAAVVSAIVAGGIQVDRYLVERRQGLAQTRYDRNVRECDGMGGHWFRGECVVAP